MTWGYAKGTDFARLKTYAWTTGHPVPDPLNDQRIVSAIEAQLAAKGFTKVDSADRPDALVAYHANFSQAGGREAVQALPGRRGTLVTRASGTGR